MSPEATQLVRERALGLFQRGVDDCRVMLMTDSALLGNVVRATRAPITAMCECASLQAANETPMNEIASVGVRQQATDDFVARVRARLGTCIQAQPD